MLSLIYGFMFVFPVFVSGWWASMGFGSSLARMRVQKVIDAVKKADPADTEQWEAVSKQALDLDDTMRKLSDGWGTGLLGFTLFCWFVCTWELISIMHALNACPNSLYLRFQVSATSFKLLTPST